MFTKSEAISDIETIIGPSVTIEGGFTSQSDVRIEGAVTGSILTNGNLMVGEQANIAASVQANSAYVAGHIKGNLLIKERLELAATSKIDGDINTKILVVTEGAQLSGKCHMGTSAAGAGSASRQPSKKNTETTS